MTAKKTILIVDDDIGMCETLSDIFEEVGYQVVTASNGAEAIEFVRQSDFELVLMDVRMPEVDGVQACKAMKREKPRVKVVLMTAFAVDPSIVDALNGYDVQVLPKPLQIQTLFTILKTRAKA